MGPRLRNGNEERGRKNQRVNEEEREKNGSGKGDRIKQGGKTRRKGVYKKLKRDRKKTSKGKARGRESSCRLPRQANMHTVGLK